MSAELTADKDWLVIAILLLAIFMAGMALRLHDLDADSLWGDEIRTATRAQRDVRTIVARIASGEGQGVQLPLMYIVTRFFVVLFGDSEFILRVQAMFFGSLSVLLVYKAGEILWTREEGLVGALLLAVSAHHVQYSQEARHYALMVFLALLSLIFLVKALEKNKKRLWIGFVICTSLSLYNHYFAFFFLPAEVMFGAWTIGESWLSDRQQGVHLSEGGGFRGLSASAKQAVMLSGSLALVGACYLPWLPTLQGLIWGQVGSEAVGVSPAGLGRSLSFLRTVLTDYSGSEGGVLLLWLGLFVLGLAACGWKRITLVLLWMGVPFGVLSVAGPSHFLRSKYVLFILPLYLVVIASGITFVSRLLGRPLYKIRRDVRWVPVVTSSVVMLLGLVSVAPLSSYYRWEKEDWRSAVAYLRQNMAEGDVIVADGEAYHQGADARRVLPPSTYYFSRADEDVTILLAQRGLADGVHEVAGGGAGVWGVLWHVEDLVSLEWVRGDVDIVEFHRVAVVGLPNPSGDVLEDTALVLETLLQVQPQPEGRFDLHVALAEIYLRTGRFEQAGLELDKASAVRPDHPKALRDLADTRAEVDQLSSEIGEDIGYPLRRNVGHVLAFVGHNMGPRDVTVGETLKISLWWQGLGKMYRDYTVFVHVLGPEGRIWGQEDRLLVRGDYPTSTWSLGDVVSVEYELGLGADTPPGDYIVHMGVYYWESGERLPVWDENGQRMAHDSISLGPINVTG